MGRVIQTCLPHHLSNIPVEISEFEAPSLLGEDTAEYLKKAGADDETIARLKENGSIRLGDDIEEEDFAPIAPTN